ncbi:MAG: hypothetical protein IJ461_04060, partial [Clostridia bacterium]|nr:hypothetical protein [Clostridia bacterium]
MNHALFSPLGQTAPFKQLIQSLDACEVTALYGLPEGIRAYLAAAVYAQCGKPVVMVTPSDLAAARAAEDAAWLLGGQAACLPSREIQFARGASSQESTWRRL